MQLLEATLAKSPRQVSTKHGQRTVADLLLPDGSEATLWRPENDDALMGMRRGDRCQGCRDSKGKVSLVEQVSTPNTRHNQLSRRQSLEQVSTHHRPLSPEQRIEIGAYMDQMANLYGYAWELANTKLGDKASEDTKKSMASTLYLSAQRRFGLDSKVEFKGGADAAVNCASPEKPGARLDDAQKPHSSVAKPTAQTGAQARPVQPSLVDVPSRTPVSASPTGSHWDIAG